MMRTTAKNPETTPIPVQLSEPEFNQFISPHLSMPSTTVVTIPHNWYLGSELMEGGRNHATDRYPDGGAWPDHDRCDGEHHRGWPRLLGGHWEAAGPLFRSFGVPPTGSDLSARPAQFGRAQEQLASGGNLRGAHPVWFPVLVESG